MVNEADGGCVKRDRGVSRGGGRAANDWKTARPTFITKGYV